MNKSLTVADIFTKAVQVEQKGAHFYREVAARLADPVKAALIEELARMEEAHEATFSALLGQLGEEPGLAAPPGAGPAREDLAEWSDGEVFDFHLDLVLGLTGRETLPEILRKAIQMEKESIVFYLWVQELVDDPVARSRVSRIVNQEFQHISRLNRELKSLLPSGSIESHVL